MTFNIIPTAAKPAPLDGGGSNLPSVAQLRDAARVYREAGKASSTDICADIANKLARFGSYASPKQQAFAASLVGNATAVQPRESHTSALRLPALFEVMQRLSSVTLPKIKISRKNQDSLCWIISGEGMLNNVGMIKDGTVVLFGRKLQQAGVNAAEVLDLLREIEANPIKAIADAGIASGRCAICSRDLTDPESIARGVGPTCSGKLFA